MNRSTLRTTAIRAGLALAILGVFTALSPRAHALDVWEHAVTVDGTPIHVLGVSRGDADLDGTVSHADAVLLARWLYLDGPRPLCLQACDMNRDGNVDVKDVSAITAVAEGQASAAPESLVIIVTPRGLHLKAASYTADADMETSSSRKGITLAVEVHRLDHDDSGPDKRAYVVCEPREGSDAYSPIVLGDESGSSQGLVLEVPIVEWTLFPPLTVIGPGIGIGFTDDSGNCRSLTIRFEDKTGSEEIP